MAGTTSLRSSVTCSIDVSHLVKGVALLGSRLCVVLSRRECQIVIFQLTDKVYSKQNTISVPGLVPDGMQDLAACAQNDCLYITDSTNKCVNRVKLETDPVQWPVCTRAENMSPYGVSVTAANNVLVTCRQSIDNSVLMEFTTRGERIRTVKLKGQCQKAVELPPDKFVVCYSEGKCLRIVNSSGDVVWSYDELAAQVPSSLFAQRVDVIHAALDTDGFIFVSDILGKKVISISQNSTVRRVLLASGSGLNGEPGKMCFEPDSRRLFVVDTYETGRDRSTRIVVMHVAPFSW